MKMLIALTAAGLFASTAAFAQPMAAGGGELLTSVPTSAMTVTDWYKQDVYDQKNNKIGEIMDVLVNRSGQVDAAIVGVGGFLGAGEKDVAVKFDSIKQTKKNDKIYLTMDTTKDALKKAPGFKYDNNKTTWVPDTSSK